MKNNPDLLVAVHTQAEISRAMSLDLATVTGDTAQIRENLHELKTTLTAQGVDRDAATVQLQKGMVDTLRKLDTLLTQFEMLRDDVTTGFREDRARLRKLESDSAEETGRHGG